MLLKIAAIMFMVASTATNTPPQQATSKEPQKVSKPANCEGRTFASAAEALQSGCCSWHGGVCGCSNGRKVCCDKTLSPSCRC